MSNATASCGADKPVAQDVPRFVNLPHWVLDSGISGSAVKLYCVIAMFGETDGRTKCITRSVLADTVNTSTRTVSAHLKELVDVGAVTVEPQFDGPARIGSVYVLTSGGEA